MFLVRHYITDLQRRSSTGPRRFERAKIPLSKPIETEEGEVQVEDFLGALDRAFDRVGSEIDIEKLLGSLQDPDIKKAVQIILEHTEPTGDLWEKIKQVTGKPRSYIQKQLQENPFIKEFLVDALASPKAPLESVEQLKEGIAAFAVKDKAAEVTRKEASVSAETANMTEELF